ncbi:MAG: shikimate kinase [Myxococcota bacterium]
MGGVARTILLAGMMGSGKSTVGRRLATELGWRFIDTDEEIVSAQGMSIPEIFAREGEERFRALERSVLEGLPEQRGVVALGGGAVSASTLDLLRSKGRLLLLEASPETLASRLGDAEDRPMLAGMTGVERVYRLRALLAARADAYAAAERSIETEGRTVEQVCEAVRRALGCGEAA